MAQFKLRTGLNYGTYAMKDLKEVQSRMSTSPSPDIKLKTVTQFPRWIGLDIEGAWQFPKVELVFEAGYNATAGRLSYADYSGSLTYDQHINGFFYGSGITGRLNKSLHHVKSIGIKTTFIYSQLKMDNKAIAMDQVVESEHYEFSSFNIQLSPLLRYEYFRENFFVYSEVRLNWDAIKDPLTLQGQKDAYLTVGNDKARADWTGIRIGAGVGYRFIRHKK